MRKEIQVPKRIIVCDFCGKETTDYCVACGKDICNDHIGDSCEDGRLCSECPKDWYFEYTEDGGVGVINGQGKAVDTPYLSKYPSSRRN